MDIRSMILREDFFNILCSTVERYYSKVYNQKVHFEISSINKCNMVSKPYLSDITSVRMSKKVRRYFYNEWNIRGSFLKNLFVKVYISVVTRSGKLLGEYYFKLAPSKFLNRDLIIAPNNRSIRFFNYSEGNVGCIVKTGFSNKYIKNQINYRKKCEYSFVLPLLSYGEDWFVEPILEGNPLARVSDDRRYQEAVTEVLKCIKKIAESTKEYKTINEYILPKIQNAKEMLVISKKTKRIKRFQEAFRIIEKIETQIKKSAFLIPIVESHGDLQAGNIWLSKENKVWIYDWETIDRRSIWYDTAVFLFDLRRPYGWKKFWEEKHPAAILYCDEKKEYQNDEYQTIKHILCLEDLLFHLEDMLELPEDWGNDIFDSRVEQLCAGMEESYE